MKWLNNLFSNATMKEPEWWRQSGFVVQTGSGQSVTVDSAMKVSAVYSSVRIISEAVSALPLKIYERNADGKVVSSHNLNNVFSLPNQIQTGFELREFVTSSLLLRGNSYAQVIRSNRGQIGEIIPLYPQDMRVDKGEDGRLIFDYQETGAARVFSQNEIWRVAGLSSNGVTGLSPIEQARESIGLAMAMEEHGARLFKNGTQPDSVFQIPTTLSDDAFDRLKKQIAEHQGSGNAHKPMILEAGLERKPIGMASKDAQFIESRKLQIADIARYFRIPPHMLGEMGAATFSNIEHQSLEFVRDTITPWLVRIEASISRDLLTPAERQRYFAKHNVDGLLRGDIKARYDAHGLAIRDGWMTRNEVRALEDMNAEAGLDDFILPLNMATDSERTAQLENAAIDAIVAKEVRALTHDREKDPRHFVDFYDRHLTSAAKLLAVDKSTLLNYGMARLDEIEKGIDDKLLKTITANAADQMRATLCRT